MHSTDLLTSLTKLFETRKEQLYVCAIAITRDRAAAEDAVLDAMLAISQLKYSPDDLAAYLFRTVRNKALHSAKQQHRFKDDAELANFIDSHQQSPEQQIFVKQVLEHLTHLESNQQQVLIMKLFGDLTFQEIAEVTATNPNTVASWYRRGVASLKEKIHEPAL